LAANRLFRQMLEEPSGVVFARSSFEESWRAIRRPGHRIHLAIPELLERLDAALAEPPAPDPEYPLVLSAGERRSDTANTVIRSHGWQKKGLYGSLRISPQDAADLGCRTGERRRLTTRRASAEVVIEVSDRMRPGHISLPNGTGLRLGKAGGNGEFPGVAPNELTDAARRDFLAGTPWHKHVPARLD
jgi:anaerobic selenocysteine-containing dehydrogenase